MARRTPDLALVPANGYDGDEHPFCPFPECSRAVMQYDDCGQLVCPDCGTDALTIEETVHEMVTAAQAVLS